MSVLYSLLPLKKGSGINYWKSVRMSKRFLDQSTVSEVKGGIDTRPYAEVTINGVKIRGLLDSGASVTCIGQDALKLAKRIGMKVKRVGSTVKTADGADQPIIVYIDAPTEFNNVTKAIRFYLIPSLSQTLYLGCDFWYAFGLLPIIVEELDKSTEVDPNIHVLAAADQQRLEEVKKMFPSSDSEGLGCTSLLQHNINTSDSVPVKQQYYAVSPAVQTLMDVELDRMLQLIFLHLLIHSKCRL